MATPITTESENVEQILPFSLEEESFYIWITDLYTKDGLEALQLLSHTLNSLQRIEIPVSLRSLFIEKISILVFQLSKQLQKTYAKSYFPFSSHDSLKVKLSANCALGIADNCTLLCQDNLFETRDLFSLQQKALILVTAIQALANVLFYRAMLYEKPGKGFWAQCFLLYLLAKKNEVLDLSCNHQNTSFLKVFKPLLVFELSHVQQYNTEEIQVVYKVLNNLSEKIELLPLIPGKKMDSVPYINLRLDKPPSVADLNSSEPSPHLFYISNINLIKQLFEFFAHKKNISYSNKIIALRLIKTLTMNQRRRGERKLADNELFSKIGFDRFNQYLLHKENVAKSEEIVSFETRNLSLDAQLKKQNREKLFGFRNEQEASLSLAWRPEDNTVEYIENTDIWSEKIEKTSDKEEAKKNATVIDQSNFGFCIGIKDKNPATKVGEIIHLLIPPASVVTVVRRIVSADKYDVIAGVEVLGYDAELLHMPDSEHKDMRTAFILSDIDGRESIVIKADDYHGEEYLYATRNDESLRYRVEKTLNSSTSTIKHLKVSLAV